MRVLTLLALLIVGGVLLARFGGVTRQELPKDGDAVSAEETLALKRGLRAAALKKISIKSFRWCQYSYRPASACRFAVENRNVFDVKDVAIECDYITPSGTVIGRQRATIYNIVTANSTRAFNEFEVGYAPPQTDRASCAVADFDVPEPAGSKQPG